MKGTLKFIAELSVTMLLMLMFRALFFTIYKVPDSSLEPQLMRGDRILVNRCSYGLRTGEDTGSGYSRWIKQNISRGDITAFNYPIDSSLKISSNPVLVGLCIALPGDTVRLDGNRDIVVPGRGAAVSVNSDNVFLLCNMLRMHEHRDSYVCNGTLYVNGRVTKNVKFDKDYYWMGSLNPYNTYDSRFYGFVPEDHVIGRVTMLLYSMDDSQPFYKAMRMGRSLKIL